MIVCLFGILVIKGFIMSQKYCRRNGDEQKVNFYDACDFYGRHRSSTFFYLSQYGLENVVLDEEYVYCQEKEDSIITLKKIIVTI